MIYKDRLYGEYNIEEPVVLDIINSLAFKRLKGIDQAGYFEVYFPNTKHSRFEHSVGCYLLLKKFDASLEEQIAGLIHDVSHSAFSHTADYIFKEGRGADHNYQDDIFVDFIQTTDIPQILRQHNFDVARILDEKNFPLQETELPDLCADRIDYSLRGAIIYNVATHEEVNQIIDSLQVIDNRWVFADFKSAFYYAQIFEKLNSVYYSNKETAAMFLRTSRWVKYALNKDYITYEDLFTTDDNVINKINIHLSDDNELQQLWNEMNKPEIVVCEEGNDLGECVVVKSRIVDPLFMKNGSIKRVSDVNEDWGKKVDEEMKPKTHCIC